ncbi:MAG: hypothetical protein AAFU77_05645 [Myxococcota bacterium]
MAKSPPRSGPKPLPMTDTESQMESFHRGNAPHTRKRLAMLDDESTVSIKAPSPVKKGNKRVTPGFVGFRQAAEGRGDDSKIDRRKSLKKQMRDKRDERRQVMWDKLDSARKNADERLQRYGGFEPAREGPAPPPKKKRRGRRR